MVAVESRLSPSDGGTRRRQRVPFSWLTAATILIITGCATWTETPLDAETPAVERDESPPPSFRGDSPEGQATGLSPQSRDIERRLGYK